MICSDISCFNMHRQIKFLIEWRFIIRDPACYCFQIESVILIGSKEFETKIKIELLVITYYIIITS